MKKPEVGQVLYSLNIGNASRNTEQKLTEVVVQKVGRKYFTCGKVGCSDWMTTQYYLDTWNEKSEYSANSCLYVSRQEYEDEKETSDICRLIYQSFEHGRNKAELSLPELKTIKKML